MFKAIDHQLFKRRLMRNLEKFIGGRDYGEDLRMLEHSHDRPSDAMHNPPQPLK
ncbi:hypothetical protein Tco_1511254, partial [Tanacetum coccineum]